MREAITIQDVPVNERQASPEDAKTASLPDINTDGLNEEGFLQAAVEQIGTVVKTPQKTLDKDTFIKVFKYTGDFAKPMDEAKAASGREILRLLRRT